MIVLPFSTQTLTIFADESVENTEEITEDDIDSAINRASEYMLSKGVFSEWEAIGLAQAGKEVPEAYHSEFDNNVQRQVVVALESGRIKITDIERLAMAAVAIGKDPRDIDGLNLIELIYNSPERRGGFETMTFQGNNGPIFALIALDTKGFEVPSDAKWKRQQLIIELLNNQNEDGSWHLNSSFDSPSIDITAMALIGLSPYNDQPEVRDSIDSAVHWLQQVQTENGGFDGGDFVGGITSEAASQAIIGLSANEINPVNEDFTKNGNSLISHLLSYQNADGGFKHTQGDSSSNAMATEQALQALVAYKYFLNGKGSIYNFNQIEQEPPSDGDEEEPPSNGDNEENPPGNEDNEEESPSEGDNEDNEGSKDEDSDEEEQTPEDEEEQQSKKTKEITVKSTTNANKEMKTTIKLDDVKNVKDSTLVVQPQNAKNQNQLEVELDNTVIDSLIKGKNDLKINKQDAVVQIPTEILSLLAEQAKKSPVRIRLEKYNANHAVGSIYDFTIIAGDSKVTNFGSNNIELSLQVEQQTAQNPKAYYFNEHTNKWEQIDSSQYDSETEKISFQTNHFSIFGVFEAEGKDLEQPIQVAVNNSSSKNEKHEDPKPTTSELIEREERTESENNINDETSQRYVNIDRNSGSVNEHIEQPTQVAAANETSEKEEQESSIGKSNKRKNHSEDEDDTVDSDVNQADEESEETDVRSQEASGEKRTESANTVNGYLIVMTLFIIIGAVSILYYRKKKS